MRTHVQLMVVLLIAVSSSSCTTRDESISDQITDQYVKGGDLDLSTTGSTDWQRVCILGPYTNNKRAEKLLGFPWDAEGKSSIAASDGINLLVFVRSQKVLAHVEHPRSQGDFVDPSPRCFERQHAKLTRQLDKEGWVQYVAK